MPESKLVWCSDFDAFRPTLRVQYSRTAIRVSYRLRRVGERVLLLIEPLMVMWTARQQGEMTEIGVGNVETAYVKGEPDGIKIGCDANTLIRGCWLCYE